MTDLEAKIKALAELQSTVWNLSSKLYADREALREELDPIARANGWDISNLDLSNNYTASKWILFLNKPDFFRELGIYNLTSYKECWILPQAFIDSHNSYNSLFVVEKLKSPIILFFLTSIVEGDNTTPFPLDSTWRSGFNHSSEFYEFGKKSMKGLIVAYRPKAKTFHILRNHRYPKLPRGMRFPNHEGVVLTQLNQLVASTLTNNYDRMVDEDEVVRDIYASTHKYLTTIGVIEE
jgi:hypothetical protein